VIEGGGESGGRGGVRGSRGGEKKFCWQPPSNRTRKKRSRGGVLFAEDHRARRRQAMVAHGDRKGGGAGEFYPGNSAKKHVVELSTVSLISLRLEPSRGKSEGKERTKSLPFFASRKIAHNLSTKGREGGKKREKKGENDLH